MVRKNFSRRQWVEAYLSEILACYLEEVVYNQIGA